MAQGLQRRPKSIQPSLTAGLIRGSLEPAPYSDTEVRVRLPIISKVVER